MKPKQQQKSIFESFSIGNLIMGFMIILLVMWYNHNENIQNVCSLYGKSNYTHAEYFIQEAGGRRFCCSDDFSGYRKTWLLGQINDYEANCGEIPSYETRV